MSLQLKALRMTMRALELTAPRLGAALAERLFFTPPRSALAPAVRDLLETGDAFRVCVDGQRIAAWAWGRGPAVILAHGWGGSGGRLAAALAAPLVESGFSVVTFDAPGHGLSDGRLSSMPQFARALHAVGDAAGSVFAVVAHSMGGSASTLAISQGLKVNAPPSLRRPPTRRVSRRTLPRPSASARPRWRGCAGAVRPVCASGGPTSTSRAWPRPSTFLF